MRFSKELNRLFGNKVPAPSQGLDIFISHSSADRLIAQALIDLLRDALNIPTARIRCTSVDGYRLPAGGDVDTILRREVDTAMVVIALISPRSIKSTYVLFELGARWATNRHLIPLLCGGVAFADLSPPLGLFNSLTCDSEPQIHQLIHDVAGMVEKPASNPAAYVGRIAHLVNASTSHHESSLVVIREAVFKSGFRLDNGKQGTVYIFPARIINETNRAVTIEYFEMIVKVGDRPFFFRQRPVPDKVSFPADELQLDMAKAHQTDFFQRIDSIMPGEAVLGHFCFMGDDAPSEIFPTSPLVASMTCTDILGKKHKVKYNDTNTLPGAAFKLGFRAINHKPGAI